MQLYEKYRPTSLDKVAGHAGTIAAIKAITARPGWDSDAFWLQGASGTGKTTLANIIASTVTDEQYDIEHVKGVDCDVDRVRDLEYMWSLCSRGESGWRVAIVDEAHAMTARSVQAWLTLLEPMKRRRLVIFTSTEPLNKDLFGNFASPLSSRCKIFELTADHRAFALHVKKIAEAEGLGGKPLCDYVQLLTACEGNVRMAFQKVESGAMYASQTRAASGTSSLLELAERQIAALRAELAGSPP